MVGQIQKGGVGEAGLEGVGNRVIDSLRNMNQVDL